MRGTEAIGCTERIEISPKDMDYCSERCVNRTRSENCQPNARIGAGHASGPMLDEKLHVSAGFGPSRGQDNPSPYLARRWVL